MQITDVLPMCDWSTCEQAIKKMAKRMLAKKVIEYVRTPSGMVPYTALDQVRPVVHFNHSPM